MFALSVILRWRGVKQKILRYHFVFLFSLLGKLLFLRAGNRITRLHLHPHISKASTERSGTMCRRQNKRKLAKCITDILTDIVSHAITLWCSFRGRTRALSLSFYISLSPSRQNKCFSGTRNDLDHQREIGRAFLSGSTLNGGEINAKIG